jgi:hypothetical protein
MNTKPTGRKCLGAAALLALIAGGCAGDAARNNVLGPTMAETWPGVKEDAVLGLQARTNADAARALGLTPISEGVAASRRERLNRFDEAVTTYTRQGANP